MSTDDYQPALVPGQGAPAEHGSGSKVTSGNYRMRAEVIDWAKVAPWFVEGEERREKEREERARGVSA